jgi:hypothetical protein
MSIPSAESDQPSRQYAAGQHTSTRNGTQDPVKLARGLVLVFSMLAVLAAGITIGNAARKRINRWTHGYS